MQQLIDKLYGDMVGFGFLDKYIADDEIEEINGNSWRDIEIVTRSGWHKIPEHSLSPGMPRTPCARWSDWAAWCWIIPIP